MTENLSPAPGTPQNALKAEVAAAVSALAIFLGALLVEWTGSDPLEARDFVVALAAALAGGALTGGATYSVSNQPK
jgi:hypothetical protein